MLRFGPVESFEIPYLLRYKVGGRYDKHADSERYDEEAKLWYSSADRDVSLLISLNDDFEGGELRFSRLNCTYRPKAATLKATSKQFRGATVNPPIRI